jgi:NADH dehydrogenase [ubiquinone] 1 alpha subcomplex assembly factor 5
MSIQTPHHHLFDRKLIQSRRTKRATKYPSFLKNRVAQDLAYRLSLIHRPFSFIVDLGGHTGHLATLLKNPDIITTDLSETMVAQAPTPLKLVLDEEYLPFAPTSIDLMISALSLHWVNDIPGLLIQISRCLKPNGLFLAALLGGETLIELRDCLSSAELALRGGLTPRLSPMISVQDAGSLLQRAGFVLPVVDRDRIQVTYPHPLALLHDLRSMGETNALFCRERILMPRALLLEACNLYQKRYGLPNGQIPATFDVVTLTGWTPSLVP